MDPKSASRSRSTRIAFLSAAAVVTVFVASAAPAGALTPESPEVQAMAKRGVEYLKTAASGEGIFLAATALLKAGEAYDVKPDHPKVLEALQRIRDNKYGESSRHVYEQATALVFLCTLKSTPGNSIDVKGEIAKVSGTLLAKQKPFGGFGYVDIPGGDISQTQMATLALWEVDRVEQPVPEVAWQKLIGYFLRTQDPSGAWGYQGEEATSSTLVKQSQTRLSLAYGAAGSLLIAMDNVGMMRNGTVGAAGDKPEKAERTQPDELKKVVDPIKDKKRSRRKIALDKGGVDAAHDRFRGWKGMHPELDQSEGWGVYCLYAIERYESFREAYDGEDIAEPQWYNQGVQMLQKWQKSTGDWDRSCGSSADTGFAIMFLLRTTKKVIKKKEMDLGGGAMIAGTGNPTENAMSQTGRGLAKKPPAGPAGDLIAALEDPTNPKHAELMEGLGDLTMNTDDATLSKTAAQFRKLFSEGSGETRAALVTALAKTKNLDLVPILIMAMSDADSDVVASAQTGLRFMSRQFKQKTGNQLFEDKDPNTSIRHAIDHWKKWYLAMRPEAVLEE